MNISEDQYIGCLLGIGIGDAMGYPVEQYPPAQIKKEFGGYIKQYEQRKNRTDLKPGSVTDDTQLSLCIGESLARYGRLEPDDIAKRFVKWLDYGIGVGSTCVKAIEKIRDGENWRHSGLESAGNGSAIRVAPIGLFFHNDNQKLVEACTITSRMTHTDPKAIAASVAVAGGVAMALQLKHGLDPNRFVFELVKLTEPICREFANKLREIPSYLNMDALEALSKIRTGCYVMESIPAAIYTFLRFHDSFTNTVLIGINAGYDADSVGSIAGSLTGAYLGKAAIPEAWISGLQPVYKKKLIDVAKELHGLSK